MGPTSSAGLGMGRDIASGLRVLAGCTRQSRAQKRAPEVPCPTTPSGKCPNEGWAIALVWGWVQLRPPDSEWAETLRAASVCPRDVPSTAAPKNECPKAPVPQPPSGKCPKRGVGYSLGGGLGPTSSAGLGIGPSLYVPPPCAKNRPRTRPRPKTSVRSPPSHNPLRKMPKTRGGL